MSLYEWKLIGNDRLLGTVKIPVRELTQGCLRWVTLTECTLPEASIEVFLYLAFSEGRFYIHLLLTVAEVPKQSKRSNEKRNLRKLQKHRKFIKPVRAEVILLTVQLTPDKQWFLDHQEELEHSYPKGTWIACRAPTGVVWHGNNFDDGWFDHCGSYFYKIGYPLTLPYYLLCKLWRDIRTKRRLTSNLCPYCSLCCWKCQPFKTYCFC